MIYINFLMIILMKFLMKYLYDTVEVTYIFKGLDLVNRVSEDLWMKVHNILQKVVTKTIGLQTLDLPDLIP